MKNKKYAAIKLSVELYILIDNLVYRFSIYDIPNNWGNEHYLSKYTTMVQTLAHYLEVNIIDEKKYKR